jgi:hypothetical protein
MERSQASLLARSQELGINPKMVAKWWKRRLSCSVVTRGTHGDDATQYLCTIDERGINTAVARTPSPRLRGHFVHTNLSARALIVGPGNCVMINAGSGRFGEGAGIAQAQWTATIRYWQELGYEVIAIPVGACLVKFWQLIPSWQAKPNPLRRFWQTPNGACINLAI